MSTSTATSTMTAHHIDVVLDLIDRMLAEYDLTSTRDTAERFASLLDEHGLR